MLKTGVKRSPGPLKDLQAALLYADYENYEDSEDSGVAGEGQGAKDRCETEPWPLKRLTGSLAAC